MGLSKRVLQWVIHHEVVYDDEKHRKARSSDVVCNNLDHISAHYMGVLVSNTYPLSSNVRVNRHRKEVSTTGV